MRRVFLSKVSGFRKADGYTIVTFANRRTCKTSDENLLKGLQFAKDSSFQQFIEIDGSGTLLNVMGAAVGRIVRLWPQGAFDYIVVAGSARRITVNDAKLRRRIKQLVRRRTTCSFAFRDDDTLAGISRRLGDIPPLSRTKKIDVAPLRRERYELDVISDDDARFAFQSVLKRQCELTRFRSWKEKVCIPFLYASTGCDARAQEMSKELEQQGVPHAKVWCLPNDGKLLFTNKRGDSFKWAFHVAVVVRTDAGDLVIDPSTSDKVEPVDTWLNAMNGRTAPVLYSPGHYYSVFLNPVTPNLVEIETDPTGRVCKWYLRSYLFSQTLATREGRPGFSLPT